MPPVQCSTSPSTALHHPVALSLPPSAPELGLGFRQPRLSDAMERYRGDRDRDRDRDRERDRSRERDRDRDRYGGGPDFPHQTRRPSLFSDGPPVDQRRSPGNYRGGFSGPGGGRRAFESPSRHSPADAGASAGFPPVGGGPPGGFRPLGGGVGGGFGNDFQAPPPPLSGQKRGFPFSGRGDSPEHYDGRSDAPSRNFVKLFVGSVPRTATEEDIRPLFEGQGKVLEVALIKDKRTGQQQGCCFVKYATSEEADRAIRALHNQYTLPGGVGPIQVRYADGERERLGNGAVEYKLFVGSLNKFATEKEVEEIFAPYGRVEDVYLMRDERKQSRGCGFVKFSNKDSALAAINALNGTYMMRGCDQPLIVRFADPKRPKPGEQRTGPASGGPGFGPVPPAAIRPAPGPNYPGSLGARGPPGAWQPMSPQNLIPPPNTSGVHGFSNQFPPRSGDAPISATAVGHLGPQGNAADGSGPGAVSATSTSPQNFNQSYPQPPASGQQISPLQKPLPSPQHFPSSLPQHHGPGSYSQAQVTQASMRPVNQSQTAGQAQYSQAFPSQHVPGLTGPLPSAQYPVQQSALSGVGQQNRPSMNVQGHTTSSLANPHLPGPAQQQPLPFQQSPSQLAQMLSQQTQTLQASFQSSQQAFSQLQQQVQMMQPSNHNQPLQQNYQALKHQSQWAGVTPSTAGNTPTIASKSDVPSTSSAPVGLLGAATPAPVKCNWTEHMSPDGYKYYHNSATGESTWIKPEELTLYEQQQQKVSVQQPQNQPSLQAFPTQRVTQSTQSQPPQVQTQFRQTEQFQHPPVSSMYQAPRGVTNQTVQEAVYTQLQTPTNSVIDPARFQQGFQASQDWAWKSNSGG